MAEERITEEMPRQDWKPHWAVTLLYKIWMVLFTAFKVAVGAAATVLMIVLVCVFIFVGLTGSYLEGDIIPKAAQINLNGIGLGLNSQILYLDADGQLQVQQRIFTATSRELADLEDMPEALLHATVAIEDKRFYEHQGVDWFTTIKACVGMFLGSSKAGGSSITQQLLKNSTGEDSITVQRKVMEIFRAIELEKTLTKDQILEMYLNYIYLGQNCNGVKTAARTYFGKELQMLSVSECACLISITNNPSLYDPYLQPTNNRERRLNVLNEMYNQGWINEEVYEEAKSQELVCLDVLKRLMNDKDLTAEEIEEVREQGLIHETVLDEILADGVVTQAEYDHILDTCLILKSGIDQEDRWTVCANEDCGYEGIVSTLRKEEGLYYCPKCDTQIDPGTDNSKSMYSYFTDTVILDVARDLAALDGQDWDTMGKSLRNIYLQRIQEGGYNIYSTIDMEAQELAESIYEDLSQIPATLSGQQLQSAIVIIDNRTGDIAAIVGGVGKDKTFFGQNRATISTLQTGSSIKPLSIYAPAFESGAITPITVIKDLPFTYYGTSPWPQNDNRTYAYKRTIYSGIEDSVNAVAVNTLDLISLEYGYEFAKEKFGLSNLVDFYQNAAGTVFSDVDYSPLALGAQTFGVKVRDMATAYATFANNGVYRKSRTYTKVYDSQGNLILDNEQESRELLSEKTVNYTNYCLVNAVNNGTGTVAKFNDMEIAGKTGTTSSRRDRWFCGFTGYYTAAVWCGYDTPEAIRFPAGANSSNVAARMWKKVMEPLHKGKTSISLYDSSKLVTTEICLESGLLATDACRADGRGVKVTDDEIGVYYEDLPTKECDKHVSVNYCTTGGGVATEYCLHFAEVDSNVVITQQSLVKMTRNEIDALVAAKGYLNNDAKTVLKDNLIYQVDAQGNDAVFYGIDNKLVQWTNAPYVICPVHTAQAWANYQAQQG